MTFLRDLNVEDVTSGSTVAKIQDTILRLPMFYGKHNNSKEKFEDTKGVIRINNIHTELTMYMLEHTCLINLELY